MEFGFTWLWFLTDQQYVTTQMEISWEPKILEINAQAASDSTETLSEMVMALFDLGFLFELEEMEARRTHHIPWHNFVIFGME
jgi:hypothetical protein